jgi:hypothetical protein
VMGRGEQEGNKGKKGKAEKWNWDRVDKKG